MVCQLQLTYWMRPVSGFWSEIKAIIKTRAFLWAWTGLAVLVAVLHFYAEVRLYDQSTAQQRDVLTERLSVFRYQLESTLTNNLSLINGLAAFIASYPDFTPAQYELYAQTVIAREPSLVNLAAAPDLVVRYVYPVEGNEAAIGLNYLQTPGQRDDVLRAVESGSLVIAGPVELVQGGLAFIGRAPVFVRSTSGDELLWGIVSAPVLADSIFRSAGLLDSMAGLEIAVRGSAGLSLAEAFVGDSAIFERDDAVIMPISAGGSSWEIAAVSQQSAGLLAGVYQLRSLSLAGLFLLTLLLLLRHRQLGQNKQLRSIIFRNERFLRAVEGVSQVGGWRWTDACFTELSTQTRQIMALQDVSGPIDMATFCHSLDTASRDLIEQAVQSAERTRRRLDQEMELRRRDGTAFWLHFRAEHFVLDDSRSELIGALQDVTLQKQVDQLVEYQASYDMLTGLPNRTLFIDRLQTGLQLARRDSARLAVLFIDLDNFKSVNDNLGHDAGDELLIEVARRIQSCVRLTDTVARHSGDEFVAMLSDVFSASVVSRIAEGMLTQMRRPFEIGDHQVYCGCSVGVAFYPDDGDDADTLLIKADQAMYEVKKAGRNSWQFYTAAMQRESEFKHRLYNELVAALDNGHLSVVYQPVVQAEGGRIVGCEALARWQLADGSWIEPDIFIPLAEERGLINRIDLFVLRESLNFVRQLNDRDDLSLSLSVNVSPKLLHLRDTDARQWLQELKERHGVALTVEITERVLLDKTSNVSAVLEQLDQSGVSIAIDDFGTGYSGLSYFSRFPVSSVKIDRSFVSNLDAKQTETALVETILLMAGKLGVMVVAEGVETGSQADFLRLKHCDLLQGFHIAPPLTGDAFVDFVRQNTTSAAEIH
jgi:diguanylate cyclase (GGDEF)-like protein